MAKKIKSNRYKAITAHEKSLLNQEESFKRERFFKGLEEKQIARRSLPIRQAGTGLRHSIKQFGRVGMPQPDFTIEQESMRSMFGGGEKIWGTVGQPIRINNDLHPSLDDSEDETRSMFGF